MRVRGPLSGAGAAGSASMSSFLWRASHPLALASLYSDFVVGLSAGIHCYLTLTEVPLLLCDVPTLDFCLGGQRSFFLT